MGVDMQMLVKTKEKLTKDSVRELSYELAEKFGKESFWISRPNKEGFFKDGQHALEIVKKYVQDGDDIVPEKGETFIEVHIGTRFYGEGYERGDILLAINIAEYLEYKISDAEIFMGGDSSGICAEPFNKKEREKIKKYFFENGHHSYRENRSILGDGTHRFCDFCKKYMNQYGFGKEYMAFVCYGCGLKEETRDNAISWKDITNEKS